MLIENPEESSENLTNQTSIRFCVYSVIYNICLHNMVIFTKLYKFFFKYLKLIQILLHHMFVFYKFANYNPRIMVIFLSIYFINSDPSISMKTSRILPHIE
jgi:hypothetical protein